MIVPFRRLVRSLGRHGALRTGLMGTAMLCRMAAELWPNSKVLWARMNSEGGLVTRSVQGIRMKLDLRDAGISRELFLTGVHEVHSTQQFKEEIKPGMVLLEIGGNIGYFALLGAVRVRPGGRVLALEPSPANVKSLEGNTKLNGLEDVVKIYPFAAGRESGTLPFYVVSKSNLCGFVNREGPGIQLLEEVLVRLVPVDQVVEQEAVQVDYFRMDVEGFETEVIEGMTGTLSGPHPPSGGFIEVHSELLNRKGISARSFIGRMYELGYQIKTARYRGRGDVVVRSNFEFLDHPCSEIGYWETFFRRRKWGEANSEWNV